MYKLQITAQAKNDLDDIITYIVNKLINPTAATALLNAVDGCYQNLLHTPYMYGECGDARLQASCHKKLRNDIQD